MLLESCGIEAKKSPLGGWWWHPPLAPLHLGECLCLFEWNGLPKWPGSAFAFGEEVPHPRGVGTAPAEGYLSNYTPSY